ncbi:hypothetical protein FH972_006420 [Carpinus fangiana]|uniref:Uncharacterized protein n=1 Tax=Carpinus fangiana TaxID=176857 RepID=A0A5N6QVQ7_9ROSI|nr:hypothetical protein FH972_006420 [Carpinus fangiana]
MAPHHRSAPMRMIHFLLPHHHHFTAPTALKHRARTSDPHTLRKHPDLSSLEAHQEAHPASPPPLNHGISFSVRILLTYFAVLVDHMVKAKAQRLSGPYLFRKE